MHLDWGGGGAGGEQRPKMGAMREPADKPFSLSMRLRALCRYDDSTRSLWRTRKALEREKSVETKTDGVYEHEVHTGTNNNNDCTSNVTYLEEYCCYGGGGDPFLGISISCR